MTLRRLFGKYSREQPREWDAWRRQWTAYQQGDPVSQIVRGTWRRESGDET